MSHSTSRPYPFTKTYGTNRIVLGFKMWKWSLDEVEEVIKEIRQDQVEKKNANLMMARLTRDRMGDLMDGLDPTVKDAVYKLLRDFWSEDPELPLPSPQYFYPKPCRPIVGFSVES